MPCNGCIPLSGCGGGRRLRGGDAAPRGIGRESCVGSRSLRRVTLLLRRGKPPLPRAWRGILSLLQHAAAASDSCPSLPSPLGCRTALHPHAEAALRPPRPALRPFCWQCFFLIKMHHNSHIIPIQTGSAHPMSLGFHVKHVYTSYDVELLPASCISQFHSYSCLVPSLFRSVFYLCASNILVLRMCINGTCLSST